MKTSRFVVALEAATQLGRWEGTLAGLERQYKRMEFWCWGTMACLGVGVLTAGVLWWDKGIGAAIAALVLAALLVGPFAIGCRVSKADIRERLDEAKFQTKVWTDNLSRCEEQLCHTSAA